VVAEEAGVVGLREFRSYESRARKNVSLGGDLPSKRLQFSY
jgi:hypothetical protein